MARRSIRWIVVGCLAARLLTTFADVGPALLLDRDPSGWAVRLATAVAIIDAVLLVGVSCGRFRWVVTAWWFRTVDIAVAIGINLVVVAFEPYGTFWQEGRDPLGAYLAGTMALWAVIRGPRTGVVLLAGYGVVVGVEALGNGAPFDVLGWLAFGELMLWALISMVAGLSVMMLARQAARRAAVVVAEDTHARAMAKLHGSVVQALSRIGSLSRRDEPPGPLLAEIHALAAEQAAAAATGAAELGLAASEDLCSVVVRACRARPAVEVDLVTEPGFEVPGDVADVVTDAVVEALTNVEKHAGVLRAHVRTAATDAGVDITISDDGVGFAGDRPGFGLRGGIIERVKSVGGGTTVESEVGLGTTVRMSVPRAPRSISDVTDAAVDWFVVVAVLLRALITVALALAAPLALSSGVERYEVVVGTLVAANVTLLVLVGTGRAARLLRARTFFAADLAVAGALVLLTAALLPVGTAAQLTLLSTTVYLVPTVPLWGAVRGVRTGSALLVVAFGMELAAAAVNGVRPGWAAVLQILAHYAQVPAAFALSRMVMRMFRRGMDTAFAEGRRDVLAEMFAVSSAAMTQIAVAASGAATGQRLRDVRGIALVAADTLDGSLLARDGGLPARLTSLVRSCRRRGVDVTVNLIDPLDDLPTEIVGATIDTARVVLAAIAEAGSATAVVFGAPRPDGFLLTFRNYGPPLQLDPRPLRHAIAGVGGRVDIARPGSGGTKVGITWPDR